MIHTKFSSVLSPSQTDCLPLFQLEFDEYDSEQSIDYGGGWICSCHLHFIKQIVSHRKNTKNKLHFQEIWKKCLMPRSDILQIPPHVYWRRSECRHPIFGYTIPTIRARQGLAPDWHYSCRALKMGCAFPGTSHCKLKQPIKEIDCCQSFLYIFVSLPMSFHSPFPPLRPLCCSGVGGEKRMVAPSRHSSKYL